MSVRDCGSARRPGRRTLIAYLDASAVVKRYVAEAGSDAVRDAMRRAEGWFMCRVGYVETVRAITQVAGALAAKRFQREWPAFGVIEVDQRLVEQAAALAVDHSLRSLDALHLAAALLLDSEDVLLATWDRRMHTAALDQGLKVLPARLS